MWVNAYPQNRISLPMDVDQLNKEIEKLNNIEEQFDQVHRTTILGEEISDLKQLRVFQLDCTSKATYITKQEYIDYSFLKKLEFQYSRVNINPGRCISQSGGRYNFTSRLKDSVKHGMVYQRTMSFFSRLNPLKRKVLSSETFLVNSEGQTIAVRGTRYVNLFPGVGFNYSRQLGKLVLENNIDFAFNHFVEGVRTMQFFICMNDTIYVIEDFYEYKVEEDLKIVPLEEYILTIDDH